MKGLAHPDAIMDAWSCTARVSKAEVDEENDDDGSDEGNKTEDEEGGDDDSEDDDDDCVYRMCSSIPLPLPHSCTPRSPEDAWLR